MASRNLKRNEKLLETWGSFLMRGRKSYLKRQAAAPHEYSLEGKPIWAIILHSYLGWKSHENIQLRSLIKMLENMRGPLRPLRQQLWVSTRSKKPNKVWDGVWLNYVTHCTAPKTMKWICCCLTVLPDQCCTSEAKIKNVIPALWIEHIVPEVWWKISKVTSCEAQDFPSSSHCRHWDIFLFSSPISQLKCTITTLMFVHFSY